MSANGDPGLYRSRDEALREARDLNLSEHPDGYYEVHPVTAYAVMYVRWGPVVERPAAFNRKILHEHE